ncbi:MAG: VWA domain-containing protein [Pirellulales bacterium]
MGIYELDFDRPAYLLLLLLIPLLWYWSRESLSAMGRARRAGAMALRALVVAGLALALAEVHLVRKSDRLAVMYVLDRSLSLSAEQSKAALDFINRSREAGRGRQGSDLAGVILFGREAVVELPPVDVPVPIVQLEAQVDGQSTDLAGALRLARACFPPHCAKRIVVLSDGNENLGSATEEAASLAAAGIGIDVVPLRRTRAGDVSVEKVTAPTEVRRGSPFEVRVVLNNSHPEGTAGGDVSGKLRVFRRVGADEQLVTEQSIVVEPGKRVFSWREELNSADFFTYDAEFVPDAVAHDAIPQNNRATAYTQVHGQGRVLLVEDWSSPGEFTDLVERLRAARIEVDVRPSNQLFGNLAELQRYETVVLANVPRTSGDQAETMSQFSDDQMEMLVRNTQQLGGGLVMLGGPNSFGAGGWTNTPIEQAMPVDFQIKNAKIVPIGALVLVLDRSGSMSGEKIDMSKAAAVAALKTLGAQDQIGVVAFDSEAHWVARLQRVGNGVRVGAQISLIGADGGTNMEPGMREGYEALARVNAGIKHMIVLTDGRTNGAGFEGMANRMRKRGITTTCVAIGSDADTALMQFVAQAGGGNFYRVERPKMIPRIFMKEARRVARPLVFENEAGIPTQLNLRHEMLAGIDGPLPPMTGYVMTTVKESPLVEMPLSASQPAPGAHPLLAAWTYGLGRAVAMTTDAGQRWTKTWSTWQDYERLYTQVIRWSMRPTTGDSKLTLFAQVRDGVLTAIVTAVDAEGEFANFLALRGAAVGPGMKPLDLNFTQTAPGRYVAECPVTDSGNYFVTVVPGQGRAPMRAGVTLPHSAEFRDARENLGLLTRLAEQVPMAGKRGQLIDSGRATPEPAAEPNVFRRDLPIDTERRPFWNFVVLAAACLFLVDVCHRRVLVSLDPLRNRLADMLARRRDEARDLPAAIARLRNRKDEISRQLDGRRAASRFESQESSLVTKGEPMLEEESPSSASAATAAPAEGLALAPDENRAESYTERLLSAKRRARVANRTTDDP